jgi:hypothetical protein
VAVRAGRVAITLRCSGPTGISCAGGLRLTATIARTRPKLLGATRFSVRAGSSQRLRVLLNKTARKLLRDRRRISTTITASYTTGIGQTTTTRGYATIIRAGTR